jgi:ABC-type transport system substrate-binding protein
MRPRPVTMGIVALVLLCAGAGAQQRGGQLSYSSMQQVVAFEPITTTSLATTQLAALVFEPLVERNPRSGGVRLVLAESFQATAQSITFQLRRDVRWHDGEPLTAEDVRFSAELVRHPRTPSPLKDELAAVRRIEVLDPYSVRFELAGPIAEPESLFLGLYIVPRRPFRHFEMGRKEAQDLYLLCRFKNVPVRAAPEAGAAERGQLQPRTEVLLLGQQGSWLRVRVSARGTPGLEGWVEQYRGWLDGDEPVEFTTRPAGTGPYLLRGMDENGNIVLDANGAYHGQVPWIERIRRRRSSDKNTMINRLISEVLDLLPETPFEDIARIRASGVCQTLEYPALKFAALAFSTRSELLGRREVRRALTMLLDRQELVETYYQGQATVLAGPYAPHSWGYDFELEPLAHEPEQALAALERWRPAAGAAPLRFIISADRRPEDSNACQAIVSTLRQAGLTVELVALERLLFDEALRRGDFDIAFVEWVFDYAYNLRPLFYPGGALNVTGYDSAEVRRAFDELAAAPGSEARYRAARRLQTLLRDDCPYTFLWTTRNIAAVNRRVSNVKSSNIDPYSFFEHVGEWWISDAGP